MFRPERSQSPSERDRSRSPSERDRSRSPVERGSAQQKDRHRSDDVDVVRVLYQKSDVTSSSDRCDQSPRGRDQRLREYYQQRKELSRGVDDLRQKAKTAAQQILELRTFLTKFQEDIKKTKSTEDQITAFQQLHDFLKQRAALPLKDLESAGEILQPMLSNLSTKKEDLEILEDAQKAQQVVNQEKQKLERMIREGRQFTMAPEEIRRNHEEYSRKADESIKKAKKNIELMDEYIGNSRKKVDGYIEGVKSEIDVLIEDCKIVRDKSHRQRIKIGDPEKLFPEEFKTLQNKILQIETQMRTSEKDSTSHNLPGISGKPDETMQRVAPASSLEETKFLDTSAVVGDTREPSLAEKSPGEQALEEHKNYEHAVNKEAIEELDRFFQHNKHNKNESMQQWTNFLQAVRDRDPQQAYGIFKLDTSIQRLQDEIDKETKKKSMAPSDLLGQDTVDRIGSHYRAYRLSIRFYHRTKNPDNIAVVENALSRIKQEYEAYFRKLGKFDLIKEE